ncbi:MAG: extracellular solute-binding protein [Oscillospiraceae bacterium]|nr:extracellular solute-binding protein [Oscillospiraceae bacterium]
MRFKSFKKIFAALIATALCLTVSSCGKGRVEQVSEAAGKTADGKKTVTMYSLYTDSEFEKAVVDFNRASSEYQVEVTEYSKEYPDDPLTRFNNDIIAGKLPDLILLSPSMPVDSYISKGLLADLYEFMDKDETIDRSDCLESVLKAYETNGGLYELVPGFSVTTLVGKTSLVGSTPGWTVDEFIQLADANPDKYIIGDEHKLSLTQAEFFSAAVNGCYENFINRETGECSFDSDEFIKLMEFSNRFPKEVDREQLYANSSNYWNDYYKACRDGGVLLIVYHLRSFGSIRELEKLCFANSVTFKGYPGAAGNGAVFDLRTEIAVTSKASEPDGAWEFVKYLLSDEYQRRYTAEDSEEESGQFPIKKSVFEELARKAMERPYYENDDGIRVYYEKTQWNGSYTVSIGVNTDSDNKKVTDFINSVENIRRYDQQINSIINDEASAYFDGKKSAEEAAAVIRNRVQNYLDENR